MRLPFLDGFLVVFCEQRVEPVDPRAPNLFVAVQQCLGPLNLGGVSADDAFAAPSLLGHQRGSFQDGNVLLDCGPRHVVGRGQFGHRRLTGEGAADDVAAGGIGQGPKDPVIHLIRQRSV